MHLHELWLTTDLKKTIELRKNDLKSLEKKDGENRAFLSIKTLAST